MDWRGRIRRLVNRPDELERWRLAVMRVVDPVEWYMRKNEDRPRPRDSAWRRRRRDPVGWVAYAPLVADGGKGGALEEGEALPPQPAAVHRVQADLASKGEEWEARRSVLLSRHADRLSARARDLLAGGEVAVTTPEGTVRARLVRFRNGAVLERDVVTPGSLGHGMTRIDRQNLRNPVPVLVQYLADEIAQLGPRLEPLS